MGMLGAYSLDQGFLCPASQHRVVDGGWGIVLIIKSESAAVGLWVMPDAISCMRVFTRTWTHGFQGAHCALQFHGFGNDVVPRGHRGSCLR